MLPVKSLKFVCDTPKRSALSFASQLARAIAAVLVICTFFESRGFASDLPNCAVKYGELVVDHQLTVATMRQLERLLIIDPHSSTKWFLGHATVNLKTNL